MTGLSQNMEECTFVANGYVWLVWPMDTFGSGFRGEGDQPFGDAKLRIIPAYAVPTREALGGESLN